MFVLLVIVVDIACALNILCSYMRYAVHNAQVGLLLPTFTWLRLLHCHYGLNCVPVDFSSPNMYLHFLSLCQL